MPLREKTYLGDTGLLVHRVGLGGIPIQRLQMGDAVQLVVAALERGIDFIDTARGYTDSEQKIGRALDSWPGRVVLATKSMAKSREDMARDIETSLENLRIDSVDIYQYHNVSSLEQLDQILRPGGAVEALTHARDSGMIGHLGITGHKPWILKEAIRRFPFETVQFPFNIIETSARGELLPSARERGLGTICMKPIAGGAIRNVIPNLRFILTSGIDVAIPGMDDVDQVEENLSVLTKLGPPGEREMEALLKERDELGDGFCRRCEYCMPCPQGLNISFLHLIGAYYFRYGLKEWAMGRLEGLSKGYSHCIQCGECVKKCPYDLDTPGIFRTLDHRISRDWKEHRS